MNIINNNGKIGERAESCRKKCDFGLWKDLYIADYKPDLTEIIIEEVMQGKLVKLNLLSLFNIAESVELFADYLRSKLMVQAYTGQSQREKLKWLVEFNIEHGGNRFKELVFSESLV